MDFGRLTGDWCGTQDPSYDSRARETYPEMTDKEFVRAMYRMDHPPTEEEMKANDRAMLVFQSGQPCDSDRDCMYFCASRLERACTEKMFGEGKGEAAEGKKKACECFMPGEGPRRD